METKQPKEQSLGVSKKTAYFAKALWHLHECELNVFDAMRTDNLLPKEQLEALADQWVIENTQPLVEQLAEVIKKKMADGIEENLTGENSEQLAL